MVVWGGGGVTEDYTTILPTDSLLNYKVNASINNYETANDSSVK